MPATIHDDGEFVTTTLDLAGRPVPGTLLDSLEHSLGIHCGETTEDQRFDVDRVACLGCCALSPVVQIDRDIYSRMTVNKLTELLKNYE